jgi:predicted dehydrogenase
MKIAIIGNGGIAHTHVKELKSLGHEVSVVIGRDKERTRDFAMKYGIETYSDDISAALISEIDCIHICTPPALHYEMVKRVLNEGKHVICEKPLCINAAQAKELADLAREKQVVAAIDFNVRYYGACKQIKEMLKQQKLGKLCLIHGSYLQEFHALPEANSWRYQEQMSGKMRAVTEIGSHYIDLVRFVTGLDVMEVSADFGSFIPKRYVKDGIMYEENSEGAKEVLVASEDVAILSFRLSNGALGNVVLSEVSHGRSNYLNIELTGTKQSVWWNSEDCNRLNTSKKSRGICSNINAFGGGFDDTIGRLFADVYASIQSGGVEHNYPDFTDGYVNLAICEATYESNQKNGIWTKVCMEV